MNNPSNGPFFKTDTKDYYLDILNMPSIQHSLDDIYYVVEPKYAYRPDKLSDKFYGTPDYWYVFILRNRDVIKDPIFDLEPGIEIRIPTAANVRNIT